MHRLLGALKHRGFASQPEPNGRYFVGSGLLAAAFRFHDNLDLRQLVHPLLVRVNHRLNETVHLGMFQGGEMVFVDKVESSRPIKLTSTIGGRNPAHSTGLGKALLAWTFPSDEDILAWAAEHGPLERRTPRSVVEPDALARQLRHVRENGHAFDIGENEEGVNCSAVPLFLGGATPVAAISMSAPESRMSPEGLVEVADYLKELTSEHFLRRR